MPWPPRDRPRSRSISRSRSRSPERRTASASNGHLHRYRDRDDVPDRDSGMSARHRAPHASQNASRRAPAYRPKRRDERESSVTNSYSGRRDRSSTPDSSFGDSFASATTRNGTSGGDGLDAAQADVRALLGDDSQPETAGLGTSELSKLSSGLNSRVAAKKRTWGQPLSSASFVRSASVEAASAPAMMENVFDATLAKMSAPVAALVAAPVSTPVSAPASAPVPVPTAVPAPASPLATKTAPPVLKLPSVAASVAAPPPLFRVLIRRLSTSIQENDLRALLQPLGGLRDVQIIATGGQIESIAECLFSELGSALRCVRDYNGIVLNDKELLVSLVTQSHAAAATAGETPALSNVSSATRVDNVSVARSEKRDSEERHAQISRHAEAASTAAESVQNLSGMASRSNPRAAGPRLSVSAQEVSANDGGSIPLQRQKQQQQKRQQPTEPIKARQQPLKLQRHTGPDAGPAPKYGLTAEHERAAPQKTQPQLPSLRVTVPSRKPEIDQERKVHSLTSGLGKGLGQAVKESGSGQAGNTSNHSSSASSSALAPRGLVVSKLADGSRTSNFMMQATRKEGVTITFTARPTSISVAHGSKLPVALEKNRPKPQVQLNPGGAAPGLPALAADESFRPLNEVTCFKCGEMGHYANKCKSRRAGSNQQHTFAGRSEGGNDGDGGGLRERSEYSLDQRRMKPNEVKKFTVAKQRQGPSTNGSAERLKGSDRGVQKKQNFKPKQQGRIVQTGSQTSSNPGKQIVSGLAQQQRRWSNKKPGPHPHSKIPN